MPYRRRRDLRPKKRTSRRYGKPKYKKRRRKKRARVMRNFGAEKAVVNHKYVSQGSVQLSGTLSTTYVTFRAVS